MLPFNSQFAAFLWFRRTAQGPCSMLVAHVPRIVRYEIRDQYAVPTPVGFFKQFGYRAGFPQ